MSEKDVREAVPTEILVSKLKDMLVVEDPSDMQLTKEQINKNLQAKLREEGAFEKKNPKTYTSPGFVNRFLEENGIRRLKKKSEKFAWARYYCVLCDYHYDSLIHAYQHTTEGRHTQQLKTKDVVFTLAQLPRPTHNHIQVLGKLLAEIEAEFGLSDYDIKERANVAEKVNAIISDKIPGCSCDIFGSSVSGFGLKSSDIDLDLKTSGALLPSQALLKALEVINSAEELTDVVSDLTSKIPVVSFKVDGRHLCRLTLNNGVAFQTTALLKDYFQIDPRIRTLSSAVRYWAKMCQMDVSSSGMLPAHSFSIMLVMFSQQESIPVLPCIHDQLENKKSEVYKSPTDYLSSFKSANEKTAAELWLDFLHFYGTKFQVAKTVVSITRIGGIPKEETKWQSKKLTIEDPYSNKRPLSRSVVSARNLEYVLNCFKFAIQYFGIPQTSQGPVYTKIIPPKIRDAVATPSSGLDVDSTRSSTPFDIVTLDELEASTKKLEVSVSSSFQGKVGPMTYETFRAEFGSELNLEQAIEISKLVPADLIVFKFEAQVLTGGKSPSITCSVCTKEGHLQSACPEEVVMSMKPLPQMTDQQKKILTEICAQVMFDLQPMDEELSERQMILRTLTAFIRGFFPTANLNLYGSSCNGFAIANSDMDICLTFFGQSNDENINQIETIQTLAKNLRTMNGIRHVIPVTGAKVPIVKFVHVASGIECDISLYNTLAQENTRMLKTYSLIDPRVQILGYVVKFYAKVCDIGDASRGSLSSYAYILMMIHYLQQCQPPVVPVLQELYEGDTKPEKMVDGKNAWFFSDVLKIEKVWDGYGKNKQSTGELWVGFLEYYGYLFDDRTRVISIRTKHPVLKFEKMWMSKCFAIEDPFDLGHNLGGGLSRKMNLYIKKTLARSRAHFKTFDIRTPKQQVMCTLFKPAALCDQNVPVDRGCHACGRNGHFIRECPVVRQSEERKKNKTANRNSNNSANVSRNPTPVKGQANGSSQTPNKVQEQNEAKGPIKIPIKFLNQAKGLSQTPAKGQKGGKQTPVKAQNPSDSANQAPKKGQAQTPAQGQKGGSQMQGKGQNPSKGAIQTPNKINPSSTLNGNLSKQKKPKPGSNLNDSRRSSSTASGSVSPLNLTKARAANISGQDLETKPDGAMTCDDSGAKPAASSAPTDSSKKKKTRNWKKKNGISSAASTSESISSLLNGAEGFDNKPNSTTVKASNSYQPDTSGKKISSQQQQLQQQLVHLINHEGLQGSDSEKLKSSDKSAGKKKLADVDQISAELSRLDFGKNLTPNNPVNTNVDRTADQEQPKPMSARMRKKLNWQERKKNKNSSDEQV